MIALSRSFKAAIPLWLAIASTSAFALGAGELRVSSFIGQQLDAQFEVTGLPQSTNMRSASSYDRLKVRLCKEPEYNKADAIYPTGNRFNLSIEKEKGSDTAKIHVTSSNVISDPFLNLMMEIESPALDPDDRPTHMIRVFTVLIDPAPDVSPNFYHPNDIPNAVPVQNAPDKMVPAQDMATKSKPAEHSSDINLASTDVHDAPIPTRKPMPARMTEDDLRDQIVADEKMLKMMVEQVKEMQAVIADLIAKEDARNAKKRASHTTNAVLPHDAPPIPSVSLAQSEPVIVEPPSIESSPVTESAPTPEPIHAPVDTPRGTHVLVSVGGVKPEEDGLWDLDSNSVRNLVSVAAIMGLILFAIIRKKRHAAIQAVVDDIESGGGKFEFKSRVIHPRRNIYHYHPESGEPL